MALGSSTTPTAESIVPCPNHVLRIGWDNEAVRTPLPRLRDSDGVADAAEGVVAAVAAAGGDEVVIAALAAMRSLSGHSGRGWKDWAKSVGRAESWYNTNN